MKEETKTFSKEYMVESTSEGTVLDSVYIGGESNIYISCNVVVDGKELNIPKDITPYESAKLCQFMFTAISLKKSPPWNFVKELEIERLFK